MIIWAVLRIFNIFKQMQMSKPFESVPCFLKSIFVQFYSIAHPGTSFICNLSTCLFIFTTLFFFFFFFFLWISIFKELTKIKKKWVSLCVCLWMYRRSDGTCAALVRTGCHSFKECYSKNVRIISGWMNGIRAGSLVFGIYWQKRKININWWRKK